MTRTSRILAATVVGLLVVPVTGAAAQDPREEYCLVAEPPEPTAPAHPIRFGITPLTAGSAGVAQQEPVPHDPDRDVAGVRGLRPDGGELVMRLNRMFWADGEEGVRRYARIVDRYAAAGFPSELQVRYHPPEGAEGDLAAWEGYVRLAARILGERDALTALSITNEANFAMSPNTSDGSYEGVREAIVRGTLAARDELDRMGRSDVELGFSFAWRWLPDQDRGFWEELGELATPEFVAATDYVGLQVYPHLVWPPAPRPGRDAGSEVAEALTILRRCYLPLAGLGDDVDLWVSENGYATNLGRDEESQDAALRSTVETVAELSGTLGITDYRWFNLRDNRTDGADLFDAVGLMRDDYSTKPAYDTFRELLGVHGTTDAGAAAPAPPPAGDGAATPRPPRDDAGAGDDLPVTGGGAATALVPLLVAAALVRGGRRPRRSAAGRRG